MEPLGIYIHIPYCVRRCPYCGFYSNAICCGDDINTFARSDCNSEIADYFDILKKELGYRAESTGSSYYVDSIYFGGGTPSLADPELIGGMIDEAARIYEVTDDCEISMEANPGTVTEDRLRAYRHAGVNRLSLGIQSFDDSVLRTLGRIHSAVDARKAFDEARAAGFSNVSMDLMFGVPGQSRKMWKETVNECASMLPEHVSFYSLQIEEGTQFYKDYKMGDMTPVSDEEDRQMYHGAIQILREHGYKQYEISNAALPGRECRHNLKYWTFRDYLGIGASASSFMNKVRRTDPGAGYMAFADAGFPDSELAENHMNSDFDNAADYMITGLRLADGIDEADFAGRFGKTVWEMFPEAKDDLKGFFEDRSVIESDGRLMITERGFDISNRILSAFV
ncbi:MAG: radical SAM family heme chaperone HemW [Eubacterium sp.]|nr:radical SAM family heme chaperone HemW [Eubacterium sp.]